MNTPPARLSTPRWSRLFAGSAFNDTGSWRGNPLAGSLGADDTALGYESALPYLVRPLAADAKGASPWTAALAA